ncbi:MAG TPA: MarP family serine protease [Acidimicrobiales bacterium]|nr:MarP family serine protease [Acidimicrobiales bacterium]
MNIVDVILLVLVALSIVRGVRLGAAVQVLSFGGFWVGLFLGALLSIPVHNLFSTPFTEAVAALVCLFGVAFLLGGIGRQLGVRAWGYLRRVRLGPADAAVGAVVAAAATLLVAWIVGYTLRQTSLGNVNRAIAGSSILQRVDGWLPNPPDAFSRLTQLLRQNGLPQVFAGLEPQSAGPVSTAGPPLVQQAERTAGASTVKIVAHGCGEILEGSGFVVAGNLVVTNAHVIAGTSSIQVEDSHTSQSATPIYFDPSLDLAVLRTGSTLPEPPLNLYSGSPVPRGTQSVVLGYPQGGPFNAQPAGVRDEFAATGRNIYGAGLTVRDVYELQAIIRPGNSGGPLVLPDGTVIGVVFSTSATNPDVGYALVSSGLVSRVRQAERSGSPTGTGACAE